MSRTTSEPGRIVELNSRDIANRSSYGRYRKRLRCSALAALYSLLLGVGGATLLSGNTAAVAAPRRASKSTKSTKVTSLATPKPLTGTATKTVKSGQKPELTVPPTLADTTQPDRHGNESALDPMEITVPGRVRMANHLNGKSAIRFASLVGHREPLNVSIDGAQRVGDLDAGLVSSYVVIEPGAHAIVVSGPFGAALETTLRPDQSVIVLIGGSVSTPILMTVDDQDSVPASVSGAETRLVKDRRWVRIVNLAGRATVARVGGKEVRLLPRSSSDLVPVAASVVIEPDLGTVEKITAKPADQPKAIPPTTVLSKAGAEAVFPVPSTALEGAVVLRSAKVSFLVEPGVTTLVIAPDQLADAIWTLPAPGFDPPAPTAPMHFSTASTPKADNRSALNASSVLVTLVLIALTLATMSTLAVFRARSQQDRLRVRMDVGLD